MAIIAYLYRSPIQTQVIILVQRAHPIAHGMNSRQSSSLFQHQLDSLQMSHRTYYVWFIEGSHSFLAHQAPVCYLRFSAAIITADKTGSSHMDNDDELSLNFNSDQLKLF